MVNLVHILHSGVGGQAGVVFPLVRASKNEATHALAFYGVESLAPQNARICTELDATFAYFQKGPGLGVSSQLKMAKWILSLRPDVIISHSPATLFACLWVKLHRPRTKLVTVEHHSNALKTSRHWILSAIALLVTSRVVYLTEAYRSTVSRKLGKFLFRSTKSIVVPNGLDLSDYDLPGFAEPKSRNDVVIGMQGRMVKGKDYATLLRAFALLLSQNGGQRVRLQLAGDGCDRGALEELCLSLNIRDRVDFLGMLPRRTLIEQMRAWDIFTLSTAGETMSMAVMEAMASRKPIVATDVPGISDLIRNRETGILVPVGIASALADALSDLVHDPAKRNSLSNNARLYAEQHLSVTDSWVRFSCLFSELLIPGEQNEAMRPNTNLPEIV